MTINTLATRNWHWWSGTDEPSLYLGEIHDFYLNSTTGEIFEKTADTEWTSVGSITAPGGGVTSVNGQTGDVVIDPENIGAVSKAGDTMSGPLIIDPFGTAPGQTGIIKLRELAVNGTNFVAVKAPNLLGSDVTFVLPATYGAAGQALTTDGAGNLSWGNIPAIPVLSVNGQTGNVVLTTTDINEGTRLYFTDARARGAAVVNSVIGGQTDQAPSVSSIKTYVDASVGVEAASRAAADITLQNNITSEANTRAAADALLIPLTQKGANNGVATLGPTGKVPSAQLPPLAISDVYVVSTIAERDALTGIETGDVCVVTSISKTYIYTGSAWQELLNPPNLVLSVNGLTGAVVLTAASVGAVDLTQKGAAFGVATLDGAGKVPSSQLPLDAVTSVNAKTGDVVLTTSDITEGSRLYYTDARAQAAAVIDSTAGSQTDKAPSVASIKSYVDSSVLNEKNDRIAADNTLQTNINTEASTRATAITNLQNSLATETSQRTTADNTLQTNINTEASSRASADTALGLRIDQEITNRTAADNTLQTNINTEAGIRAANDSSLQGNIDTEQAARIAADSNLHDEITAEASLRSAQDGILSGRITTEVSDRQAADAVLQANINIERDARIAADLLLIPLTQKAIANGVATLDGAGHVPASQLDLSTSQVAEGSNLYYTNARAQAASVVNSTAGNETDKAPSVSATKSYVTSAVAGEAALRQSADADLSDRITQEVSDRSVADAGLQDQIYNERDARIAADLLLIPLTQKASANGVATLDGAGHVPASQLDLNTSQVVEGSNLYYTDARAKTAAVVNSTAGNQSDQAPSVSATKSYVTSAVAGEAALRQSADADLSDRITQEVSDRTSADFTLQGNIDAERDARIAADALLVPLTQKGVAGGVATLGIDGLVPSSQLPPLAITDVYVVATIAQRDALTGIETGDVCVVTDLSKSYIYTGSVWQELLNPPSGVSSVNGQTGSVNLSTSDIPEGTNTYFTDTRAKTAAVVNSTSGSQTDQAPSVSATKSYVTSAVAGEAALRQSADADLSDRITQEVSDRSLADADLQTQIYNERDARIAADLLLIPLSQKASANGVATLDGTGHVPASQLDLSTSQVAEGSNLYFTDSRAKTASVVNSTSGSQTDQAPSVSAVKSYVTTSVSSEAAARSSADTILQANIDAEASARGAADTTLQNNINSEASTRQSQDALLEQAIADEASARALADGVLQDNIDGEASIRAANDLILQTNINNEASARASADTTLQNNITAEQTARIAADNTLQSYIDDEQLARIAADSTLQDHIDEEAQTRANADDVLQQNIDDEATARSAADNLLQTAIDNEVSARQAAVLSLQGDINSEISARQSADAILHNEVLNEASARQSADGVLQSNIDAEALARQAADALLIPLSQKGSSNGVATLDGSGHVPASQLDLSTTQVLEGTNLYFTDNRAKNAAVVNSLAGDQTDQAPSVHSVKGYVSSAVASEASAREAADALLIPLTQKGIAGGVATLGLDGLIPESQLPPIAITDVYVVATLAERDELSAKTGDVCVVTDINKTYIYNGLNWIELQTTSAVTSVNGQTGDVSLSTSDIAEGSNLYFTALRAKTAAVVNSTMGDETDQAPSVHAAKFYADSAVSSEAALRASADNVLQQNIDNEAIFRAAADSTLQTNINNEAFTRAANDSLLQGQIDDEVLARQSADLDLQDQITNEVTARSSADLVLQGNINTEASTRENADILLQSNINTETANRIAADALLIPLTQKGQANGVATLDGSGHVPADQLNLSTTQVAEGANLYFTDTRAKTAAVVDSTADNQTDQAASVSAMKIYVEGLVQSEANLRTSADALLQGNIDSEAQTRANEDIILQGNIDAEIANRIAADALLIPQSEKAQPNGVATLDGTGHVPSSQLPPYPVVPVTSVNGQIGDVVLSTSDIGEGSNLYFTDTRAKTAAVVDSMAGSQTDQAPSVLAVKDFAKFLPSNVRYVTPNGSDVEGNGSQIAPYATIQAAMNSLPAPVAGSDVPDCVIYVHPGVYVETISWTRTNTHIVGLQPPRKNIQTVTIKGGIDFNIAIAEPGGLFQNISSVSNCLLSNESGARNVVNFAGTEGVILHLVNSQVYQASSGYSCVSLTNTSASTSRLYMDYCALNNAASGAGHALDLQRGSLWSAFYSEIYRTGSSDPSVRAIKLTNNASVASVSNGVIGSSGDYSIEMAGTGSCTLTHSTVQAYSANKSGVYVNAGATFTAVYCAYVVPAGTGYAVTGPAGSVYVYAFNIFSANTSIGSNVYKVAAAIDTTTTSVSEGTNLYFTNARAKTAAVVDSMAGSQTDQAPSVSSVKNYVASHSSLVSLSFSASDWVLNSITVIPSGTPTAGQIGPHGISSGKVLFSRVQSKNGTSYKEVFLEVEYDSSINTITLTKDGSYPAFDGEILISYGN